MRITLSLFLLCFSLLASESKIYLGTGFGYGDVVTNYANSPLEENFTEESARLKIGYGQREAYAVEFSMDYIASDPKKYAFEIALIKAFDWDIYINPYVKAGFGSGIIDNRDNENKSLTYGSFNLGTGFFLPLNEHFDMEFSYEYKNRSYEKVNELDGTESRTSHVNMFYAGLNVRF